MARTGKRTSRVSTRRLLRREVPSTVGLVADAEDFAAMRRYRTFAPAFAVAGHAAYLREMEGLLRALAARGVHTSVVLFDPEDYEGFCAGHGLEPDACESRTRYTAQAAAGGAAVPYAGQSMELLVPQLLDEAVRRGSAELARGLLAAAGECEGCGAGPGEAAGRAADLVDRLLGVIGPGSHHIVATVRAEQAPMTAVLHVAAYADGLRLFAGESAGAFCSVLAAGMVTGSPGAVVLRTVPEAAGPGGPGGPGGVEAVRGWRLVDGWLVPLSEAEVFAAYCTDALTGEPVPPEEGVEYRAGPAVPRPEEDAEEGHG